MDKIWLNQYDPGIKAQINPDQYSSISELFSESCDKFQNRKAFHNLGYDLSYQALSELVDQFAAYLQQHLKIPKGERVALMMPNILQFPIALFGTLKTGLVAVNVNPLYTARELKYQLNDAGCTAIVILSNMAHTLESVLAETSIKHIIVTDIGDALPQPKSALVNFVAKYIKKMVPNYHLPYAVKFKQALRLGQQMSFEPVSINGEDLAFLQYTGGTTGDAKGAELTHRNMIANLEQAHMILSVLIKSENEVVITPLPLYHIFSLTVNCLLCLKIGGHNILITNPRDIPSFIKTMKQFKFTIITAVNTLFNCLTQDPSFKQLDFSQLSLALGGGMAVQESVALEWKKQTGCHINEGYGLTETSPCVTVNPPLLTEYTGSIGVPLPSTDISIRNEQGQEVGIGKEGELCIKGPQVMRGYWNNQQATQAVFTDDGYFKTGDIATIDEKGFVRIVDRKKDMILVSGFNVYPNEIENIVAKHASVLETACIGVPDEQSTEAVKVFIVKKPNASLSKDEIIEHCREFLTGYKIPKYIEFSEELPKSNVGKILRRKLRK